jgi:hypothetical protein
MENTTTKPRTFTARNIAGGAETWRFWKDGKYWRLQGPDAYTPSLVRGTKGKAAPAREIEVRV